MLLAVFCLALTSGMAHPQPAAPAATVTGRLLTEDGRPLASGTVAISPGGHDQAAHAPTEAVIQPDGTFVLRGVPPGDYVIRARAKIDDAGPSLFATFVLAVRSRDVQHVDLMLAPGATLRGTVTIDRRFGSAPPALGGLRVRAPLVDGSTFGDAHGAAVHRDGSFLLDAIVAGTHVLEVEGLPFPWRISDAQIQGRNAVERSFDVEARQQVRDARIVISDMAAGVAGTVSIPPGSALSDVLVVAYPADPLRRTLALRYVRTGRPAPDGSYRIVDLAPEEYRVIAALHATEQDALNPDVLERWSGSSAPVSLAATRVSVVPLTAAPVR